MASCSELVHQGVKLRNQSPHLSSMGPGIQAPSKPLQKHLLGKSLRLLQNQRLCRCSRIPLQLSCHYLGLQSSEGVYR